MNILWADDQVEVARTFSHSLDSLRAKIDFAPDGESALVMIGKTTYDLAIVDLAMPPGRWGGLWLIKQLQTVAHAPPVVVVSGEGSQSETIDALRLGAADYVTKERLAEELLQQASGVLERHRVSSSSIKTLIAQGESSTVEFKATLRFNLRAGKVDSSIELAALKSIAGFLNGVGGSLLIGVSDDGRIVGVEHDKFENPDRFQLHFWNLFREAIGSDFLEFVQTHLCEIESAHVLLVRCARSNRPVFVKWKREGRLQELFYVRAGPQTEQLETRQALTYIQDHFGG